MTTRDSVLALVVLASLAGCGSFGGGGAGARSASSSSARGKPQRTPPPSRRPSELQIIARPVPDVLGEGLWVAVMDADSSLVIDEIGAPDRVAWLGARLDRSDAGSARTLVKVRRAAFGVHVPLAGERAKVSLDVLEERGIAIDTDTIVLFGETTICPAHRGDAIVTALDDGGHTLDVRWQLEGCPAGPWAPFGLSAPAIPTTLRWVPPSCEQTEPEDPPAGYGRLLVGELEVARFDAGTVWIARADSWTAKSIATVGSTARGCPPTDAAPPVDESNPSDDVDDVEPTGDAPSESAP